MYLSLALYGKSLLTPAIEITNFYSFFLEIEDVLCFADYIGFSNVAALSFEPMQVCVCVCVCEKVSKHIHTHSFYSTSSLLP